MCPDGYPSFLLCPSLFLLPNLFYLLHRNSSGLSPALQSSVTVLCLLADRVHPFLQKSKAPLNLVGASLTQPLLLLPLAYLYFNPIHISFAGTDDFLSYGDPALCLLALPSSCLWMHHPVGEYPIFLRPSLNITTSMKAFFSTLLEYIYFSPSLLFQPIHQWIWLKYIWKPSASHQLPAGLSYSHIFLELFAVPSLLVSLLLSLVNRVSSSLYSQNFIKVQIRSCHHLKPSWWPPVSHQRKLQSLLWPKTLDYLGLNLSNFWSHPLSL